MARTQGVFLTAFGKRGYAFLAHNLALSIKHFNPEIKVALYHDSCISQLWHEDLSIFDLLIPIHPGETDPATIKTSVYDILPFDDNLYLDVDALALHDVQVVFDELCRLPGYYYSHFLGSHTLDQGNEMPHNQWSYADETWKHFKLPNDTVFPSTNSSLQFIRKGKQAQALFARVVELLKNPLPHHLLKNQWGGGQPDELYMNVAMAEAKITGQTPRDYLFFGHIIDRRPLWQIKETYPILSILGGRRFSRPTYTEWYDKLMMKEYCRTFSRPHRYKYSLIVNSKHASTPQVNPRKPLPKAVVKPFTTDIPEFLKFTT
jgi:hypothetical protein